MHLKGLGNTDDYLSVNLNDRDKVDLISFDDLVLCFDDLERISGNLKIEELIGYINSLVENENIKVLIIANENKIPSEKYAALKEKIVGNSIEFNLNIEDAFVSLVKSKFQAHQIYSSFLLNKKEYILEIFSAQSSNLRILGFAMTHFQYIYSDLNKNIAEEPALQVKLDIIILQLLKFTLAIAIEYKQHKITFNKREGLESNFDRTLYNHLTERNSNSSKEKEITKSFKDLFLEQYYPERNYYFFNSIFNFITGGNIFNYLDLKNELKKLYHIEDKKVLPQYEIFESLKYMQAFLLNDREYKQRTYKLLGHVDKGDYDLLTYMTTFYFATRFDNPYRFNLEKIEKRIINGMRSGKPNYKYIPSLDFHLTIHSDSENINNLTRIRDEALKINSSLGEKDSSEKGEELEELFYSNFSEFNYRFFDNKNGFIYEPVLKYFNPNRFYSHFLKSTNARRWEIVNFLTGRYRHIGPEIKLEIHFLESLNIKIEKKLKALKSSQPSQFLFKQLHLKVKTPLETLRLK